MTTTMREKIARKIADRQVAVPYSDEDWAVFKAAGYAEILFDYADAALDALEEPTEEMIDAANAADGIGDAEVIWQAMIRAARTGKMS